MDETTVNVTAAGGDYSFFSDDLSVYSSPSSLASSPAVLPQIVVLTSAPTTKYEVTVTPNKSNTNQAQSAMNQPQSNGAASSSCSAPSASASSLAMVDLTHSPSVPSSTGVAVVALSPLQSSSGSLGLPSSAASDVPSSVSLSLLHESAASGEAGRTIVAQLTADNEATQQTATQAKVEPASSSSASSSTSSSPSKSDSSVSSLPMKIEPQPPSAAAIANIPASITSSPQYQKDYNEYYTKYYATYYNHYFQAGYSSSAPASKDSASPSPNGAAASADSAVKTENPSTIAAAQAYAHHYASYYAAQHAAASAAHKQQQQNGSAPSPAPGATSTSTASGAPPASAGSPKDSAAASSSAHYNYSGGQYYQSSPNGSTYPAGYSYGQYQSSQTAHSQPASGSHSAHQPSGGHSSHSGTSPYCTCASCVAQFGSKGSSGHANSDGSYSYYGSKSGPCNCTSCVAAAASGDKNAPKHGSYSSGCPCPACAQARGAPSSYQYSSACNCASCLAQRASGNGTSSHGSAAPPSASKGSKDKDSSHGSSGLSLLKSINGNAPQTPQGHHHSSSGAQTPGSTAPGSSKKAPKSAKKAAVPGSASKAPSTPSGDAPKSAKKDKSNKDKEKEKEKEKEKAKEKEKKAKEKEKEKEREAEKDRHGGLNIGQLDLHSTDDLIHLPGDEHEHVDSLMLSATALQTTLASRTHSPSLSPALSSSPHPFDPHVFAPIVQPTFSPALPSLHSPTSSPPLASLLTGSGFPAPFPRSPRLSFMRGDAPASAGVNTSSAPSSAGGANGFSFFSPSPATRSPKFGLFSTLLNSPSPAFSLPSPSLPPMTMLQKNPLDMRKSPQLGTASLQSNGKSESKAASPEAEGKDGKPVDGSVALPKTPSQSFMRSPISIAINSRSGSPDLKPLGGKSVADEKNLSILDKLQSLQSIGPAAQHAENTKKRRRDGSSDLLLSEHMGTPKLKSASVSGLMLTHSPPLLPLSSSPLVSALAGSGLQLPPIQKSSNLAMCHQCKVRKPILTVVYCCNHSKNRKKYRAELQAYQAAQLKAQEQKDHEAKTGKKSEAAVVIPSFTSLNAINLAGSPCPHRYCEGCLLKYYGEKAPAKRPPISSWTCPKCRGTCSCRKCRREREKERNYADPSTMPPALALASALVYAGEELNEEMRAFREEAERELAANPGLIESMSESDDDLLAMLSEAESLSPSEAESEHEAEHQAKRKKASSVSSTPRNGSARRPSSRRSNGATPLILAQSTGSPNSRSKAASSSGLGSLELPPSAFSSSDPSQALKTDSLLAVAQQAKFEHESPMVKPLSGSLFMTAECDFSLNPLKSESVVTQSPQMRAMLEAASSAEPALLELPGSARSMDQ